MRRIFLMRSSAHISLFFCCTFLLHAQAPATGASDIVKTVSPSVASVITTTTPGTQFAAGSAIVIRPDGVLLAALSLVRNTGRVMIRLQNGEVYDQVDLIGFDERRGVAALRIAAVGLKAAVIGSEENSKEGGPGWVLPHPGAQEWRPIRAKVEALKLADEIPGAGFGHRVWPLQAAVPPGSSGAPLVSDTGQVIGILTAGGGDGSSLAIPIGGVIGLANGTARIRLTGAPGAGQPQGYQAPQPTGSAGLANVDPRQLLQTARSVVIQSKTVYCKPEQLASALQKLPEFEKLGLLVVNDYNAADLLAVVDRPLFTFDFTYSLTHNRTGLVVSSGKVLAGDGAKASSGIAKKIVNAFAAARKTRAK